MKISSIKLMILTAVFWMAFANFSFFNILLNDYPLNLENTGFLIALVVGFTGAIIIALSLFCHRYTIKPLLILLLISSSFVAYFMDSYNTMIDDSMIQNTFETDIHEMADLLSPTMLVYVLLLGVLPAIFVSLIKIQFKPLKKEIIARTKLIAFILVIVAVSFFTYSPNANSFFRGHKTSIKKIYVRKLVNKI